MKRPRRFSLALCAAINGDIDYASAALSYRVIMSREASKRRYYRRSKYDEELTPRLFIEALSLTVIADMAEQISQRHISLEQRVNNSV